MASQISFTALGGPASVAASLGLPAESYVQMMTLRGLNLTTGSGTDANFTPISADAGQPEEAGSFEMSNGQIVAIETPESTDSGPKPSTHFSDPVISMSFNGNSTSIVADHSTSGISVSSVEIAADTATSDSSTTVTLESQAQTLMAGISTPEPGTEMLIGIGLVAVGAFVRVKRSASKS
jgi:hypothetical protein